VIDRLVLRCDFANPETLSLRNLGIPLECSINPDGTYYGLRHRWESIPSSFSGLACKVYDTPSSERTPFIEIKASPAKLAQGHNLFGSDNLGECAYTLIEVLYQAYPVLFTELDHDSWEVAEVDITYHSRARNQREVEQFINALQNVSNGQTKARVGYSGTSYFGQKNSRIKKVKVYDKLREFLHDLDEIRKRGDPFKVLERLEVERLKEFAANMIRWEVTLKTRWFTRRDIPTNLARMCSVFDAAKMWQEGMADILKALEGEDMRLVKDDEVMRELKARFGTVTKKGMMSYANAQAAYRTYRAIKKEGWQEVRDTMAKTTFNRHVSMLHHCGFSRASLQNMHGEGIGGEVIPFVRFVSVEFGNQFPEWYQHKQIA